MPEITVFAGYLAAAVLLADPTRKMGVPSAGLAIGLVCLAVPTHLWLLADATLFPTPDALSLRNTISLSGWMLGSFALLLSLRPPLRALAAVFAAAAAFTVLATEPGTAASGGHTTPLWQFLSHVSLATLSWSLFVAAATLAVLTAAKDRYLRRQGAAAWATALPPLQSMERLMFGAITVGFVLLSLAIFSGLVFVEDLYAQHLTHKTVLTLLAWMLFAVLLIGRWRLGWRGRKSIHWTLASFGVLALAYFGSRIVLEVVLGRQWG